MICITLRGIYGDTHQTKTFSILGPTSHWAITACLWCMQRKLQHNRIKMHKRTVEVRNKMKLFFRNAQIKSCGKPFLSFLPTHNYLNCLQHLTKAHLLCSHIIFFYAGLLTRKMHRKKMQNVIATNTKCILCGNSFAVNFSSFSVQ